MITRNGAVFFSTRLYTTSVSDSYALKNIDGTTISSNTSVSFLSTEQNNPFSTVESANQGVVMNIGTGDTAATKADYCLETPLTVDDYICTIPSSVASVAATENGDMVYSFTFSARTSFTVKEIGLFALCAKGKILLARKVLSTPRAVEAGETFTFTYTIDY